MRVLVLVGCYNRVKRFMLARFQFGLLVARRFVGSTSYLIHITAPRLLAPFNFYPLLAAFFLP